MSTATVTHLQSFLAVARLSSFSAAAREIGVSRAAVSHSVRELEEQLRVVLLTRTTRSVSVTDAGRRLMETAGPALGQVFSAMNEVSAQPGEVVGRLRLSVPRGAIPFVIDPVVAAFRARHPRIDVEIVIEERFVDIVAEKYDAGIRLSESIERDMIQVRLTDPFRFVIVGAPKYLAREGTPERPEDLLKHQCITLRMQTTGALYAWELARGRKNWRIPVRGGVVCNDARLTASFAEQGLGLAYTLEPMVVQQIRKGRLQRVLERYTPTVPGFFLFFPSVARKSAPLRLFIETAKKFAVRKLDGDIFGS
jgi:DNA-binding transcriptional LysR family regulator